MATLTINASATILSISTNLSGLNEFPTNNSPGTGTALVIFDDVAHTLDVQVNFSGLDGTTTASHIHGPIGPTGIGPVITVTPTFIGFPLGVKAGTYNHIFDMTLASSYNPSFLSLPDYGGDVSLAEAGLFALFGEGKSYFNIHTIIHPGGEIRGNLVSVPEPAPVPEPSTFLLLGAGRAELVAWRRKSG